jgi:hypothetical protein
MKMEKKKLLQTVPGMREGEVKGNDGRGEFSYDSL